MRRCVFLAALAAAGLALAARAADRDVPEGFQPLFNGKDLSGWQVNEGGKLDRWGAGDGILFTTGKPGGGWLMTEKEYGDFEVMLEYKVPEGGNSGVGLRSNAWGEILLGNWDIHYHEHYAVDSHILRGSSNSNSLGLLNTFWPRLGGRSRFSLGWRSR